MQDNNFFDKISSDSFLAKVSNLPIECIKLPTRANNIINSLGKSSIIDVIHFVYGELPHVPSVGKGTISKSLLAVEKFVNTVEETPIEDIERIFDNREEYFHSTSIDVSEIFPELVELYLNKTSGNNFQRNKDIIEKRFGLAGSKIYTLEEIALYYDLTKERVRQIEQKIIKKLHLLLEGKLNTKTWKISESIQQKYRQINTETLSQEGIVSEQKLKTYFPKFSPEYLSFFMEVLGYVKIPDSLTTFRGTIQSSWYSSKIYKKKDIESIFSALDCVFDNPIEVPLFEIIVAAKRKNNTLTNDIINNYLPLINEIKIINDCVQVEFNNLSTLNKAFRLLYENGKSMHFSEIARIINAKESNQKSKILRNEYLAYQMGLDNRFAPIGRSGEWALSDWDGIHNITIVEAIRIALHKNGKPMSLDDLLHDVCELRPASKNSLIIYLNDSKLFTKVSAETFALKEWKLPPIPKAKITSKSEFNNTVKKAFSNQEIISFPNLINIVSKETGMSKINARLRLSSTKGLEIRHVEGKRNKEVFCSDLNLIENFEPEQKNNLRDIVQQEIKDILSTNPNTPITKGELYKEVSKNIDCLKQTFYQYLSVIDDSDIKQYKEGNSYFVVYSGKM